jgi:hypothetical protein
MIVEPVLKASVWKEISMPSGSNPLLPTEATEVWVAEVIGKKVLVTRFPATAHLPMALDDQTLSVAKALLRMVGSSSCYPFRYFVVRCDGRIGAYARRWTE